MKPSRLFHAGIVLLLVLSVANTTPAQQPAAPANPAPARGARAGGSGAAGPTVVVPPGHPTVFLWPNGAPGSEARKGEAEVIRGETIVNVHNPSIIVFLPPKEIATGVGMIVAPAKIGASVAFSGGELAELVAIRNDPGKPDRGSILLERFSSRPRCDCPGDVPRTVRFCRQ